jgi:hypothetical protein
MDVAEIAGEWRVENLFDRPAEHDTVGRGELVEPQQDDTACAQMLHRAPRRATILNGLRKLEWGHLTSLRYGEGAGRISPIPIPQKRENVPSRRNGGAPKPAWHDIRHRSLSCMTTLVMPE